MKTLAYSRHLLPISFFSGIMLYLVMFYGAGVSTDSIVFLNAAENILKNGTIYVTAYGKNIPMTHFPPLYPLFLAEISFILHSSIETSAKIAAAVTFGVNLHLLGIILLRCKITFKNAIFAVLLLALSEYMILIHATVFTEPLFITFMLLSFLFFEKYLRTSQMLILILTGGAVGLACLTRYAGLPLIPMIALLILVLGKDRYQKQIKPAVIFLITASLPLALWFVRNLLLAGTSADRGILFHPLGIAHIRQLIRSILFVFLPNSVLENLKMMSGKIVIVALGLILFASVIFVIFAYRKLKGVSFDKMKQFLLDINPMLKILLLFLIVYPLFLVFSISFADYTTPLSYRILLPEFIIVFPLIICGLLKLQLTASQKQNQILSYTLKIVLIFFLFSYAFRGYTLCRDIHTKGLGYSSLSWKNSKLIKFIKTLAKDTPIYTNGTAGIFYQTKRTAFPFPYKYKNGKPNPRYTKEIKKMQKIITEEHGVIIYFNNIPSTLIPSPEEIQSKCNLKIVEKADDGVIIGTIVD